MPYGEKLDGKTREIDEAAFNAWPSIRQILYDGWVLRFSRRYTKRANAVYPWFPSTIAVEKKISFCEKIYTERKMATIFRLTPGSDLEKMDRILENRGYLIQEPSLVMDRPLKRNDFSEPPSPAFQILRPDSWHRSFAKIAGLPPEKARIHEEIVSLIPGDVIFSAIVEEEETIAVGLGVRAFGFFGMFDLVTRAEFRKRGYGTKLVRAMLLWAAAHNADRAYLQVVGTNRAAQNLYLGLGFQKTFDYWYRVLDAPA
jgi:N-acetylglutamate synthase